MNNVKTLFVSTLALCSWVNATTFFIENQSRQNVTVEFLKKQNSEVLESFTLSPGYMMDVTEQVGVENLTYRLRICRDKKSCIFLIPFTLEKRIIISKNGEIVPYRPTDKPTAAMIQAAFLNRFYESKRLPFFVGLPKPPLYYENYDRFKQLQKIIAAKQPPHLLFCYQGQLQQLLVSGQGPA